VSKEASPAFQWYPKEYLSDINTQVMTIEEEGCYRRLIDFCWIEGSLPNDLSVLSSLCKGITPTPRVVQCFSISGDRLVHKRLDVERTKQEEWRRKSAEGGRLSAHKRKHPKDISNIQGGSTTVPRVVQPKVNSAVCSLQSASADNNTSPKSPSGADAVSNFLPPVEAFQLAEKLKAAIVARDPKAAAAKMDDVGAWAKEVNQILKHGRTVAEVGAVIVWCQAPGNFWNGNILSGKKLREKFDTLYAQMQNGKDGNAANSGNPQDNRGRLAYEPEYVPRKD
jgi:uncharacterized protein YdaU (DUF1376 family)